MLILAMNKILPDERGRVFLTLYSYTPEEVNNALFMGMKDDSYGEYKIAVQFNSAFDPCLNKFGVTQPNEIVYHGTIRNGRNATIVVMKNE